MSSTSFSLLVMTTKFHEYTRNSEGLNIKNDFYLWINNYLRSILHAFSWNAPIPNNSVRKKILKNWVTQINTTLSKILTISIPASCQVQTLHKQFDNIISHHHKDIDHFFLEMEWYLITVLHSLESWYIQRFFPYAHLHQYFPSFGGIELFLGELFARRRSFLYLSKRSEWRQLILNSGNVFITLQLAIVRSQNINENNESFVHCVSIELWQTDTLRQYPFSELVLYDFKYNVE